MQYTNTYTNILELLERLYPFERCTDPNNENIYLKKHI